MCGAGRERRYEVGRATQGHVTENMRGECVAVVRNRGVCCRWGNNGDVLPVVVAMRRESGIRTW